MWNSPTCLQLRASPVTGESFVVRRKCEGEWKRPTEREVEPFAAPNLLRCTPITALIPPPHGQAPTALRAFITARTHTHKHTHCCNPQLSTQGHWLEHRAAGG